MIDFVKANGGLNNVQPPRVGRLVWRCTVLGLMLTLATLIGASGAFAQTTNVMVTVTITSDNAYVFGFGTVNAITSLPFPLGVENCTAGQIFNCIGGPETYSIVASLSDYIYIAAWSDEAVYQGVLAEFTDGTTTILTGPGTSVPWEVYDTGDSRDPICPAGGSTPSLAAMNTEITTANNSSAWVNTTTGPGKAIAFGPGNSVAGTPFPLVCGIAPTAQWMWYNPDPITITQPFVTGSIPNFPPGMSREYYIFRIGPLSSVLGCPTPLPPVQDICGPLQQQDCQELTGAFCLPTCVHWDGGTGVTALECDCRDDAQCHVVTSPGQRPHCDMGTPCANNKMCVETVEPDGAGGAKICCCCPGDDLVVDLTTGVDDNTGAQIPIGSPDDTWSAVQCDPSGPFAGPFTDPPVVVAPVSAWATLPPSQWISSNFNGPNGDYCYKTCFCLNDGFQNDSLTFTMLADDGADVIVHNAQGVGLNLNPPPNFAVPYSYSFQGLFLPGENCIEVVVHNMGGPPTGFSMTGQVTADNAQCCPSVTATIPTVSGWGLLVLTLLLLVGTKVYFGRRRGEQLAA